MRSFVVIVYVFLSCVSFAHAQENKTSSKDLIIGEALSNSIKRSAELSQKSFPILDEFEKLISKPGCKNNEPTEKCLTAQEKEKFGELNAKLQYFRMLSVAEEIYQDRLNTIQNIWNANEIYKSKLESYFQSAGSPDPEKINQYLEQNVVDKKVLNRIKALGIMVDSDKALNTKK